MDVLYRTSHFFLKDPEPGMKWAWEQNYQFCIGDGVDPAQVFFFITHAGMPG